MKKIGAAITFLYLAVLVFLVWLGAFCVNYSLEHTLHKTIPFIWALVVTIFTGDLSVLVAIFVKVLILLGFLS